MRMLLLSICLVQAASATDDPPPLLLPEPIWAAEAGVHPTTQPGRVYDGISDALKTVPPGVLPSKPEDWNVAKMDAANLAFEAHVQKRRLKIRLNVAEVARNATGDGYDVKAKPVTASIFTTNVQAGFSAKDVLEVARLKTGDDVVVEGTVSNMHFEQSETDKGSVVVLAVELGECRVVK
jgi:hypothetical protein